MNTFNVDVSCYIQKYQQLETIIRPFRNNNGSFNSDETNKKDIIYNLFNEVSVPITLTFANNTFTIHVCEYCVIVKHSIRSPAAQFSILVNSVEILRNNGTRTRFIELTNDINKCVFKLDNDEYNVNFIKSA